MQVWEWLGAIAPILILFLLMAVLHLRTQDAALIGILCAAVSALVVGQSNLTFIGMDLAKGAFSALNILLVIWPAMFLYEILDFSNVFQTIKCVLQRRTQDELMRILLIAWLFSSFLQSITGFGVPVAVCAPLLIAMGVRPLWAVILTLLGHAWANTYGTFALAWNALMTQSETAAVLQTGLIACALLWLIDVAGALLLCWFYGRGKAVRHMLPFVLVVGSIHGGGQLLVGCFNAAIAAFLPTTAAIAAACLMLGAKRYTKPWQLESKIMTAGQAQKEEEEGGRPGYAVMPFLLLAAISVLVLQVPPVHDALNRVVLQLSFPAAETGRGFAVAATSAYGTIHILTHAGFVLLATVLLTYLIYRRNGMLNAGQWTGIVQATLRKIVPASLGILFLIIMAQVLKGSGLMQLVAEGVTNATGRYYGVAVPFVGLLGAFVTSSNTSSNILLGSFQKTAADLLGAKEAAVLAAQTAGAAIGTVVGPSTILLGTTTAGCKGREGSILKFMLPIVFAEAAVVGIVTFLLI